MNGPIAARCPCGQLSVACEGDPIRVSVCHCRDCQRRSGSAFAAQIRFPTGKTRVTGDARCWSRTADSGKAAHFHFCPTCGTTLWYDADAMPGVRAIPIGAFAGITLPAPEYSVYEGRKLAWVEIVGDGIEHHD